MTPLWLLAAAHASTVEMDGARWRALQDPDAVEEEAPAPGVLAREVQLDPRTDEVRFEASWTLWSAEPQWYEARIAGPGVHVASASYGGRELAITEAPDGVRIAVELSGKGTLVLRGVAVGDARREAVTLDLLPAAVGRVRVRTSAEPRITANGPVVHLRDGIWTGASGLALQLTDPTPPAPRPDLAIATAALGLTVGEGSYDAQGRVRWEIRHGELSTVVFDGSGMGADLSVTGPTVASWDRSGDRVRVTLLEPEDRLVELSLSWSGPVPEGDEAKLALPSLRPQGAFKTESSVQLARDGEVEVVPELGSWTAIPFADLPEWGRGLVVGTPTATFAAGGAPGGTLNLFRFTPVAGPPTFVDVATITAAATRDGAVLMRAHYAVRNDRSPHLRITPPAGAQVVGARVAGETARIARDGSTWLVPLGKSVETVEGLLSFPVELILLLDEGAWDHREKRAIPIPRVDAPVAVTRATLHLPPGYHNRIDAGEGDVVADFSQGEGIAYGKGTGESAQAEALMQEAVQAWMGNAFEDAEALLEELEQMGALDENAKKLQSNLDVISGKGEGQYDVALERRVKEQAKARSLEDRQAQEEALKEAERQYLSGDYAAAEQGYQKALDLGEKLDKLEQSESVEVETRNAVVADQLALAKQEAEKKEKKKIPSKVAYKERTEIDFDGIDIEGELAKPDGQSIGSGGLGSRGSGVGGGGAAEGLGGLGTTGTGTGGDFRGDAPGEALEGVVGGVAGGVVGGVVGGEVSGSFGSVVASNAEAPVTVDLPDAAADGDEVGFATDEEWDEEDGPVPFEEPEPSYDTSELLVVERQRPSLRLPKVSIGGKDKTAPDPAPPPPASPTGSNSTVLLDRKRANFEPIDLDFAEESVDEDFRSDDDAKPAVRAVQLTTVIPTQGEAVRFEHLLLEAGAAYALTIDATVPRRDR